MLIKTTSDFFSDTATSLANAPAEVAIPNVAQARFINLKLITSRRGAKIRLAEKTALNPSVISHILKHRYTMTDDVSFKIESAFELPAGFLDQVHSVVDFPDAMRDLLIRDDLSSVADILALISRQSAGGSIHTGFPTVSEFEKLPSLKLDNAVLGLPHQGAAQSITGGPLLQALCLMLSQRIDNDSLTEETALRMIQVLMNDSPSS
jgi:plasmid maintenance system antidote protein VapI